jgi:hypothetical protein
MKVFALVCKAGIVVCGCLAVVAPATINRVVTQVAGVTDPGAKWTPESQREVDEAWRKGIQERLSRLKNQNSTSATSAYQRLEGAAQATSGSEEWKHLMYEAQVWALKAEMEELSPPQNGQKQK